LENFAVTLSRTPIYHVVDVVDTDNSEMIGDFEGSSGVVVGSMEVGGVDDVAFEDFFDTYF
jgi:hypothetical protein